MGLVCWPYHPEHPVCCPSLRHVFSSPWRPIMSSLSSGISHMMPIPLGTSRMVSFSPMLALPFKLPRLLSLLWVGLTILLSLTVTPVDISSHWFLGSFLELLKLFPPIYLFYSALPVCADSQSSAKSWGFDFKSRDWHGELYNYGVNYFIYIYCSPS